VSQCDTNPKKFKSEKIPKKANYEMK
jgi:hypothetical protein